MHRAVSSLVHQARVFKQRPRAATDGQAPMSDLLWGRIEQDGLPFEGSPRALLREQEIQDRQVTVRKAYNRIFDLSDPDDNKAYLEVLEASANVWWEVRYHDLWRNPGENHMHAYVEWFIPVITDGEIKE